MSFLKKIAVLLVVVAVAVFAGGYALRPEALVRPVTKEKALDVVPGSVTVIAEYAPPLLAEVGGRLLSSELAPGKSFKKGDILAEIDPTDLKLEIKRIEIDMKAEQDNIRVGS